MLEGALHALMVGVAESYLGAFAVELGHGPERLALLTTLPLLAGAAVQLLSPLLCGVCGGRKRLVMAGAMGQTLSLAALLTIALLQSRSLATLLAAQLCFWTSAGAMAPAWNAWMKDLTRHTDRGRYFARRSGINQLVLLVGLGVAGHVLQRAGVRWLDCFAGLFGVGVLARGSTVVALYAQADLEPPSGGRGPSELLLGVRRAWHTSQLRVAAYVTALAFGTQLAAPFFTPYMLRELSLDYRSYAALSALSILAKALTFPCCHRLSQRFGLERLLVFGGVGVTLTPLIWASSSGPFVLVLAQLLGGTVWALVEFASYQLLLESAPADLTGEFFAIANSMAGVAQVVGAGAGGYLLSQGLASYSELFVLSASLRALPLAAFVLADGCRALAWPWRELAARAAGACSTGRQAPSALLAPGELRPFAAALSAGMAAAALPAQSCQPQSNDQVVPGPH